MIEGGHDRNREIDLEATELARQRGGDFIAVNRPAEPVVPAAGSEHAALLERLSDLVGGQPSEDVEQQGVIDDHEEDGRYWLARSGSTKAISATAGGRSSRGPEPVQTHQLQSM